MQQQILIEYRPELFSPRRSGPQIAGDLTFVPGVKSYPLDKWKALESQPHVWAAVQSCLEAGILRVISQSQSEKPELPSLPKNQTEAIAYVKKTFVVNLLKSWAESDNRPAVKNAIATQLKLAEEEASKPQVKDEEKE